MDGIALTAGLMSTALFVISYLPMLHRAWRTRDLGSYSRPSLVLANIGNLIQAVYVYSLPLGPIWFLHGFYVAASALMLGLHLRHHRSGARAEDPPVGDAPVPDSSPRTTPARGARVEDTHTHHEGATR